MSTSKIIWSSPQFNKIRILRNAQKSNLISIASLKFQVFFFLAIVSEMCLNVLLKLFGGPGPCIYLYKLMCKTVLCINLLLIVSYIYQIIHSGFMIYVATRTDPNESVLKSLLFDLVPSLRHFHQRLLSWKCISQWIQKEALEQERRKTQLDEERRKSLCKMYLPSANVHYKTITGFVLAPGGRTHFSPDLCNKSVSSCSPRHFGLSPNMELNSHNTPLDTSTPFSRRKVSAPFCYDESFIHSVVPCSEDNMVVMKYQPSMWSPPRDVVHSSPGSLYIMTRGLPGVLPEVASSEVWCRLGIECSRLDQWILNLRQWLHGTIVTRVVQEMEKINTRISELGISEVVVGESNIQTLRQLSQQPGNMFPTLALLINFLDCSKDQTYVVSRIKELNQGSSLGKFQWDSGSTSLRHPWREHLPNDTMLLLHLLSAYIDSRVHSNMQGVRTFSQQFIVDNLDNKDPGDLKDACVLLQANVQPPHFKVIFDQTILEIAPGRRNLFECLLVFFYKVYRNEGSMRWLNLGRSGLNLNWIFDDSL